MKIAYLLFGQLRIHDYDEYFKFINTLREKYDVDFYSHIWHDSDQEHFDVSSWCENPESAVVKHDALEQVKKNIPFVKLEVSKPITFLQYPEFEKYLPGSPFFYNPVNYNNLISQMCTVQRTCKLVDKSYDLYILARYDIILNFENLPDFETMKKGMIYKENDFVQFFSSDLLDYYQNCFDDMLEFEGRNRRQEHVFCAESLRMTCMRRDGIVEHDFEPNAITRCGRRA